MGKDKKKKYSSDEIMKLMKEKLDEEEALRNVEPLIRFKGNKVFVDKKLFDKTTKEEEK